MLVPLLRLLAIGAATVAAGPTVTLPNGATVSGLLETNVAGNGVHAFRGIPYAEPPVGDKRWKQSTLKPIQADMNATAYGSTCLQVSFFGPPTGPSTASEDCLFLNIFSPAGATKDSNLPVMVWVHGGAFVAGSGNDAEGHNIIAAAGEKVVVVSLNYRVGVFGFFSNAQILGEGNGANFGLRDQEVAFQWVKQYIQHFGGNPHDITAFGESAGSMSISLHMISRNGNQKLFHRAIMESGTYTTTPDIPTPKVQENQKVTIANGVGCADAKDVMACLRQADANEVLKVGGSLNWIPTVDKVWMLEVPIQRVLAGKVSRIPIVIGTNADEGWLFTIQASNASQYESYLHSRFAVLNDAEYAQVNKLYPESAFATPHHRIAEIFGDVIFVCPSEQFTKTVSATSPTYRYRFNYTSNEFGYPLVVHGKDVAYVFNHVDQLPKDVETKVVVNHFQTYWTNLALTGSPNGNEAAQSSVATRWPLFSTATKQQLVIQPTLTMETMGSDRVGHEARCAFWTMVEQRVSKDVAFV